MGLPALLAPHCPWLESSPRLASAAPAMGSRAARGAVSRPCFLSTQLDHGMVPAHGTVSPRDGGARPGHGHGGAARHHALGDRLPRAGRRPQGREPLPAQAAGALPGARDQAEGAGPRHQAGDGSRLQAVRLEGGVGRGQAGNPGALASARLQAALESHDPGPADRGSQARRAA